MGNSELEKLLGQLDQFKKKVTKNKAASTRFLKKMGVLTPKGNIAKRYQDVLCIQPEQA